MSQRDPYPPEDEYLAAAIVYPLLALAIILVIAIVIWWLVFQ